MAFSSGHCLLGLILSALALAAMAGPLVDLTDPTGVSNTGHKVNTIHKVSPTASRLPVAQADFSHTADSLRNRTSALENKLNGLITRGGDASATVTFTSTGSLDEVVPHKVPIGDRNGVAPVRRQLGNGDDVVSPSTGPIDEPRTAFGVQELEDSDPAPATNTTSFAPVFTVFLVSCGIAFLVSVHIVYLSLSSKHKLQTTPLNGGSHDALHGVQINHQQDNSFDTTDGFAGFSPNRNRTRRGSDHGDMIQMEVKRSTSGANLSANSNSPPGCARPLELSFLFRQASYSPRPRDNASLAASTSSSSSRSIAAPKPTGMIAFESVEADLL